MKTPDNERDKRHMPGVAGLIGKALLTVALLAGAGCGASTADGTDSNTHWLRYCDSRKDCTAGLDCLCGVCTTACRSNSACSSLEGTTACALSSCESSAQACTLACGDGTECPEGFRCEDDTCQPQAETEDDDARKDGGKSADDDAADDNDNDSDDDDAADDDADNDSDDDDSDDDDSEPLSDAPECRAMDAKAMLADCSPQLVWIWNGRECLMEDLCSCDGADCDAGFASQFECWEHYVGYEGLGCGDPSLICQALDARPSGKRCASVAGYSWNGQTCEAISCGCVGSDCSLLTETLDQCEQKWAGCSSTLQLCSESSVALTAEDLGYFPAQRPYGLSAVHGFTLEEAADAFSEWTEGRWLGYDPTLALQEGCGAPLEDGLNPCTQTLSVETADGAVLLDIYGPWTPELEYLGETDIVYRIDQEGLFVRERQTDKPLLIAPVPNAWSDSRRWELGPIAVAPGELFCKSPVKPDCNWITFGQTLQLLYSDIEEILEPGTTRTFTLLEDDDWQHQISFNYSVDYGAYYPGLVCGAAVPRTDGFILQMVRRADP